jgi:hypothetical protein
MPLEERHINFHHVDAKLPDSFIKYDWMAKRDEI